MVQSFLQRDNFTTEEFNSSIVLKGVIHITITNHGEHDIIVMGDVVKKGPDPKEGEKREPGGVWSIDPSNTYFDFKYSDIKFTNPDASDNKVNIKYQTIELPSCK